MTLSPRLSFSPEATMPLNADQLAARDEVLGLLRSGHYAQEEIACFCGVSGGAIIAERDRYGLPVRTVLCANCGVLRSSPRLTPESTARFYDVHYRRLYSGALTKDQLFDEQRNRGRGYVELLPSLFSQCSTVFDVGCGTGGMLFEIAAHGKSVAGCEYENDAVAFANGHGVRVVQDGPGRLLETLGYQADLVMAHHVIEHFCDLAAELEDLIAAVRPGGYLFVTVPGVLDLDQPFFASNLLRYLQNAHNLHFTAATLEFVLSTMGLHVVATNETALAVALKPLDWTPGTRLPVLPPRGHANEVLAYLKERESRF